jgi:hypothetical protein
LIAGHEIRGEIYFHMVLDEYGKWQVYWTFVTTATSVLDLSDEMLSYPSESVEINLTPCHITVPNLHKCNPFERMAEKQVRNLKSESTDSI